MALALDGNVPVSTDGASNSSFIIAGLTTTSANDIVIVVVVLNDPTAPGTVSTVSATGGTGTVGTFTKRSSITGTNTLGSQMDLEVWWALATTTLTTKTITVNFSGTPDSSKAFSFAISGANTAAPWDTNGSLPKTVTQATSGTPTATGVSTSNANDILLGFCGLPTGSETAGSGYTLIISITGSGTTLSATGAGQYQIVSSTQSSISVAFGTGATFGYLMIADAIRSATVTSSSIFDLAIGH